LVGATGAGGSDGTTSTGTGTTGAGGGIIVVAPPPSDSGGAVASDAAACSGESHEGERLPLDMYFLVDESGSMGENVQGGTKWKVVSDSLVGFLNDPGNADIGVGIGYFPLKSPTCMPGQAGCLCIPFTPFCFALAGGSCELVDYATPSIRIALPPNHAAVVTDLGTHGPGGGTPTRPALEGAMQYVTTWASANTTRKSVVVLATDGEPSGCSTNSPQDVANVAAAALKGTSHLQTFVIGVGKSLTSLNLIAQSGGTGQAFLVDTGASVAQAFTDALNQIRGQAASCDFNIPAQTAQGPVDPHKVNVYATPKGAAQRTAVLMVQNSDPANCGPAGGWYYDDPAAPKVIKLCDSSCQSLNGGRVEVELGCVTQEITVK